MNLTYSTERDRFEFASRYEERHPIRKAGCWWDPHRKQWWTDDTTKAMKFIDVADDAAKDRLRTAKAEMDAEIKASQAADADIDIPAPPGLKYRPFQKAGIAYALKRRATLIGDEMGLGKTIQALGVVNANQNIRRVLVVCPASLKLNWLREAEKWLTYKYWPLVHDGRNLAMESAFRIVNWDLLSRFEAANPEATFDLLIADEAHYAKNEKAQRSKALRAISERCEKTLLLTGTPVANRPVELYNLVRICDPSIFPNFMRYAKRYCDAHHNGHGWDFSGASNLDELQAILRSKIMVRRLKSEVLTELPAKTRALIEIAPTKAHRAALKAERAFEPDRLKRLLGKWEEGVAKLDNARVFDDIADAARKRHATALAKVPDVVRFVEDILESENKVILFAHHQDVIQGLKVGLCNHRPVVVTGETPMKSRQQAVELFQNEAANRVFIGNIQAAGTGLTLTAARTVVFAELDWVPGNVTQAEDRAHRIGQKDNVTVYHVVVEDSIDCHLAKTIMSKQDVIRAATDDGGEIAKIEGLVHDDGKKKRSKPVMTPEQRKAAHEGIRQIAGDCDGAVTRDNVGFDGGDTRFGKLLAGCNSLTDGQAQIARKLCGKYWRQVDADTLRRMGVQCTPPA